MGPDLSRRDRERFVALRERLEDVSRGEPSGDAGLASEGPLNPMLATTFEGDLGAVDEDRFVAERKFDGTRLLLEKFEGAVTLYTRRHVERSATLPRLAATAAEVLPDGVVLDGEYTFLTPEGRSQFVPIHAGDATVEEQGLEGTYVAFDVLALDGRWCTRRPLEERRERLETEVPLADPMRLDAVRQGGFQAFFDDLVADGEEGLVLKRRSSAYHPGTRSVHWRKVKAVTETDVVVVGYTPGEGRRSATFGALVATDGERYVGRVGSGFTEGDLEALAEAMSPVDDRPVRVADVGGRYTPVEPFVAEVRYQAVTPSGSLRAPVFVRTRPDKPVEDVEPIPDPSA